MNVNWNNWTVYKSVMAHRGYFLRKDCPTNRRWAMSAFWNSKHSWRILQQWLHWVVFSAALQAVHTGHNSDCYWYQYPDEYLDNACHHCNDYCNPRHMEMCRQKCPEYYSRLFAAPISATTTMTTTTTTTPFPTSTTSSGIDETTTKSIRQQDTHINTGIILGILVVLVIVLSFVVILLCWRRRRRRHRGPEAQDEVESSYPDEAISMPLTRLDVDQTSESNGEGSCKDSGLLTQDHSGSSDNNSDETYELVRSRESGIGGDGPQDHQDEEVHNEAVCNLEVHNTEVQQDQGSLSFPSPIQVEGDRWNTGSNNSSQSDTPLEAGSRPRTCSANEETYINHSDASKGRVATEKAAGLPRLDIRGGGNALHHVLPSGGRSPRSPRSLQEDLAWLRPHYQSEPESDTAPKTVAENHTVL